MRIKPGSRACTAFISPFGTLQYKQMWLGLAIAGSVYNRILDPGLVMKKVSRDFWKSYLDDILNLGAHFGHLTQVVLAHKVAGIQIQPCKTKLFQSKVEYLGHKICKGGV